MIAVDSHARAEIIAGPILNPLNSHYYYLISKGNWTQSEAAAQALGGHLATVGDVLENTWISSTFSNYGNVRRHLWIGLNDVAEEGTYVWVSGEPVTYTNWGEGEPNNFDRIEDFGHILAPTDPRSPRWNDAPELEHAWSADFFGVVEVATVPEPSGWLTAIAASLVGVTYLRRKSAPSTPTPSSCRR